MKIDTLKKIDEKVERSVEAGARLPSPSQLKEAYGELTMNEMSEKQTYTISEAAELLSMHAITIRRAIKRGELKAAKLGKDYRISKSDLEKYYQEKGGGKLFE